MISRRISDIFSEPFRRNIGICLFFGFEFNFGKKKSIIVFVEDIKFDRQAILFRDQITGLGDDDAVGFWLEMLIGFLGQRRLYSSLDRSPLIISQIIFIILPADADDRIRAEITLLDFMERTVCEIFGSCSFL